MKSIVPSVIFVCIIFSFGFSSGRLYQSKITKNRFDMCIAQTDIALKGWRDSTAEMGKVVAEWKGTIKSLEQCTQLLQKATSGGQQ